MEKLILCLYYFLMAIGSGAVIGMFIVGMVATYGWLI